MPRSYGLACLPPVLLCAQLPRRERFFRSATTPVATPRAGIRTRSAWSCPRARTVRRRARRATRRGHATRRDSNPKRVSVAMRAAHISAKRAPPPLPIMPTTTDRARQHSARRRRDRDSSPWEEERGAGRAGKARTLDRAPRRRWSMRTRGARSSGSTRARRASAGVGQAFGRTENVRSPRARRRFRRGKR